MDLCMGGVMDGWLDGWMECWILGVGCVGWWGGVVGGLCNLPGEVIEVIKLP